MSSSDSSVVISEDEYISGPVLSSGVDKDDALTIRRVRIPVANPDVSVSMGGKPGYAARHYLAPSESRVVMQAGKRVVLQPRKAGETSLCEASELCIYQIAVAVDFLKFHMPETALDRWFETKRNSKSGRPRFMCGTSVTDPTLVAFGRAALTALENPEPTSQFYTDHLIMGLCSYLIDTFGDQQGQTNGGLAPWQERRAKELIESRLSSDLSLDELAYSCGLSVAHFVRAFRQSLGETPHRWLTWRRIRTAQLLLISTEKPLVEIAAECGFSDQAHFTNIFAKFVGVPPGAYRRERLHNNASDNNLSFEH
jgi:AraC family transcriptional regulator